MSPTTSKGGCGVVLVDATLAAVYMTWTVCDAVPLLCKMCSNHAHDLVHVTIGPLSVRPPSVQSWSTALIPSPPLSVHPKHYA